MLNIGTSGDLCARIASSTRDSEDARPIAILAGSGLTASAVPDVNAIIRAIRKNLDQTDAAELDQQLRVLPSPSEKYQAAFAFLGLRKPPGMRDRIIRTATLAAYPRFRKKETGSPDLSAEALAEYEADVDGWVLPPGVESLGRIWAGMPRRLRGPIVTTNFDPLCEVSIGKAGGYSITRMMDADGAFMNDYSVIDAPQIIHVHGYWRESKTLNIASQLMQERPALNGSLRALLAQFTLMVIGYGGWRDAVTTQLSEIVREQSARELDILWTFFGDAPDSQSHEYEREMLERLKQAPGNVQFYANVDVNTVIPILEQQLSPILEFPDTPRRTGPRLTGWLRLSPEKSGTQLGDKDAALTFFDGRLPNWQDARNTLIPRRDVSLQVYHELENEIGRRNSSLTILIGASGEGKSTALMQIASLMAAGHDQVSVYFSTSASIDSVDQILALPSDQDHLLVIDDAFRYADAIRQLVMTINQQARKGIHILLASRDTDWSSVGGFTFSWSKYIGTKQRRLRGVSRTDAVAVINSWETIGDRALGNLQKVARGEGRIESFMRSADPRGEGEGTFFGALLVTRYGSGLRDHIRELLIRLADRQIYVLSGTREDSLVHAFYLISIPDAVHVRSMSPELLADIIGISEQEVQGGVLLPLQDEAAISFNSKALTTRHPLIARNTCELADDLDVDIHRLTRRMVTAAVHRIERYGALPELLPIAYLSQHLEDGALQLTAANAAVEASPNRISYRTSLSRALRANSRAEEATRVCEETLPLLFLAPDSASGIRPLFTEWSVAEGNLGRWSRNTVLAAMALQDFDGPQAMKPDKIGPSLGCLSHALKRMWEVTRSYTYINGLGSLAFIGLGVVGGTQDARRLQDAGTFAFRNGASPQTDLRMAANALSSACRAAESALELPLPQNLPNRGFVFEELVGIAH